MQHTKISPRSKTNNEWYRYITLSKYCEQIQILITTKYKLITIVIITRIFQNINANFEISNILYTVMSLLEAPCAKTSWRALLFRTILGITGALIVCFDNWWFKQANNSETCFGGHHCDFEQHVPCLAVYVCMNSEWSSYLRRPALLFCVGATIPWQCADSFGGRFY